jgi:hypothetical protein
MKMGIVGAAFGLLVGLSLVGCSSDSVEAEESEQAFSSNRATLLDFELDGELETNSAFSPEREIKQQLLYSVGALNEQNSVGRLDALQLTNVTKRALPSGKTLVSYHAVLPVGWGAKYGFPKSYTFRLPRDVSSAGQSTFLARYGAKCIDLWSAHDVSVGNYWYYYRTNARGCAFAPEDVLTTTAKVTVSANNTDGKYPEYDKVWADGVLRAIVIFGKDRPGATTISDFGVSAYGRFNAMARNFGMGTALQPAEQGLPGAPGADRPEVNWSGVLSDGRRVEMTVMLVDNPRDQNTKFDRRYAELSGAADLIVYNGHAALGDNVRALTRKGSFVRGQYTIVSMMGCDSFAYVDGYMAAERARLNPDDPSGTKYLDMITNVTPANPTWLPTAAAELMKALIDTKRPQTYVQIMRNWEPQHRAVVTGDEDNTFTPATP